MTTKTFKPFTVGEVVKTRDGRSARIICVDRDIEDFPVVALVRGSSGYEGLETYTMTGSCWDTGRENVSDLIREPVKTKNFQTVYMSGLVGGIFLTKEEADAKSSPRDRVVGTLERIFHDGECVDVVFHHNTKKGN